MSQALDQQTLFGEVGLQSSSQNNYRQNSSEEDYQQIRALSALEPSRPYKQDSSIFKKQDNKSFVEDRQPAGRSFSKIDKDNNQLFISQEDQEQNEQEQRQEYFDNQNQKNNVVSQGEVNRVVEEVDNEAEEDDENGDIQFQQTQNQQFYYENDEPQGYEDNEQGEDLENSIILQMYISIPGKNEDAILELMRNEKIIEVAKRFAKKNNLDQEAEEQIVQALYAAVEDKQGTLQEQKIGNDECIKEEEEEYYDQGMSGFTNAGVSQFNKSKQSISTPLQKTSQGFFERANPNSSLSNFTPSASQSSMPGVRLYNLSEKKRKKREENIKQSEREKEELEIKGLKNVPEINQKSAQIIQKKRAKGEKIDKDDAQIKDFKISMIKQYQEQKELEECTFQPKINTISRSLGDCLKQYRNFKDVYSNLYFESRIKKINKQQVPTSSTNELDKECTFQPYTNKSDKLKVNITSNFLDRNKEFLEKKNQKAKNMQYLHQNVDITTGRKLFEPNPFKNHSDTKKNNQIFEELYNLSEKKKKQQIEEEKKRNSGKKQIQLSEQTNNIVEKQRKRKIEEIFNKLDDDGDGLISGNKISIEKVDKNVVLLLLPILEEIDKRQIELDFQQFYEGFNTYFNSMNASDRHLILFGNSKTEKPHKNIAQNNFTFSPQINQKSQKIAAKRDYLDIYPNQGQFYNGNNMIQNIQITEEDANVLRKGVAYE